jgi:hypothetical protein
VADAGLILEAKFAEAQQVLGMTINYQKQFKELADRMASEPIAVWALETRVLPHLWTIDEDMGKVARAKGAHDRASARRLRGRGLAGTPPATVRARSGPRSTPSSSTSNTAAATPAGPAKSTGPLRTRH